MYLSVFARLSNATLPTAPCVSNAKQILKAKGIQAFPDEHCDLQKKKNLERIKVVQVAYGMTVTLL